MITSKGRTSDRSHPPRCWELASPGRAITLGVNYRVAGVDCWIVGAMAARSRACTMMSAATTLGPTASFRADIMDPPVCHRACRCRKRRRWPGHTRGRAAPLAVRPQRCGRAAAFAGMAAVHGPLLQCLDHRLTGCDEACPTFRVYGRGSFEGDFRQLLHAGSEATRAGRHLTDFETDTNASATSPTQDTLQPKRVPL